MMRVEDSHDQHIIGEVLDIDTTFVMTFTTQ